MDTIFRQYALIPMVPTSHYCKAHVENLSVHMLLNVLCSAVTIHRNIDIFKEAVPRVTSNRFVWEDSVIIRLRVVAKGL